MSASVTFHGNDTRIASPASAPRPIAFSTWLVCTLPELHAAPALTAIPSRSSAMTCTPAAAPGNAIDRWCSAAGGSDRRIRPHHKPPRRVQPHRAARRDAPDRPPRKHRTAAAKPATSATAGVPPRRPRSCPPATDQRFGERRVRRQQQRADTGRPAQLVRGYRHAVRPQPVQMDRHPPGRLDRVHMQQRAMPPADRGSLRHRLDHARLVVGQHQADQRGHAVAQLRVQRLEIDNPVRTHRHDGGIATRGSDRLAAADRMASCSIALIISGVPGDSAWIAGRVRLGAA